MKVRFAVSVGSGPPDRDGLAGVLQEAEERGFDTVWFSDLPSLPAIDPMLALPLAATATRRMKLGVNFVPFGYKPYAFARLMAQLDRLTEGRLLLTLVPGLDLPGERAALGTVGRNRGRMLDELIPVLRSWWSGDAVTPPGAEEPIALPTVPIQQPLEIWLGGSGPDAISRAGRLADGWLGSLATPDRAAALRTAIVRAADAAGRSIDPEHFGLSIGYARQPGDIDRAVRIRRPRASDPPMTEVVPVGAAHLRSFVGRLIDAGLSKFVVRPIAPVDSWSDELEWLATNILDLQT